MPRGALSPIDGEDWAVPQRSEDTAQSSSGAVLTRDELDMPQRTLRRLPVERFIEDGSLTDKRTRWEDRQREKGYTRVTLRVHADDCERLKKYAAKLLKARQGVF